MKGISVALNAHYQQDSISVCSLWRAERLDGAIYGFTDLDRKVTFGGQDYEPSSVYDASANQTSDRLNVDTMEVTGILDSEGITEEDIEAGLWDDAKITLRQVNYEDLTQGAEIMRNGDLGEVQRKRGTYTVELRGLAQKLQNNIGEQVLPTCPWRFGSQGSRRACRFDVESLRVNATVGTVTSRRVFVITPVPAVDTYGLGEVTFTSGENENRRMEVKALTVGGESTLQLSMPRTVAPGDTLSIIPGCDKTPEMCKAYGNFVNFGGFPFVPGQDKATLFGFQQASDGA